MSRGEFAAGERGRGAGGVLLVLALIVLGLFGAVVGARLLFEPRRDAGRDAGTTERGEDDHAVRLRGATPAEGAAPGEEEASHGGVLGRGGPRWELAVRARTRTGVVLGSPSRDADDRKGAVPGVVFRFAPAGGGQTLGFEPGGDGWGSLHVRGRGVLTAIPDPPWLPYVSGELRPPASGRLELEVVVEAGQSIRGEVRDADDRPVGGVRVWAHPVGSGGWDPRRAFAGGTTLTRGDGAFVLGGLSEGRYRLEAVPPSHGYGDDDQAAPAPLIVEAGAKSVVLRLRALTRLRLHLTDAGSGACVDSVVRLFGDDLGGEVPLGVFRGGRVKVTLPHQARRGILIEAEGYAPRYLASKVLLAKAEELTEGRELVDAGEEEHRVGLQPESGSRIEAVLHLHDEEGTPVTAVRVIRRVPIGREPQPAEMLAWNEACPDGRLVLLLPPGRHALELQAPWGLGLDASRFDPALRGLLPKAVTVEIAAGRRFSKDLVLTRGGVVRVRHAAGAAFESWIRPRGGWRDLMGVRTRRIDDATTEHEPVPPGEWDLVFKIGDRLDAREVTVTAGAVTEVTVD